VNHYITCEEPVLAGLRLYRALGMAEELTEKLIKKVRECVFLYDPGHPQ